MHILFISSWYPTRRLRDNGNFVVKHAEAAALMNKITFLHVEGERDLKTSIEPHIFEQNHVKHYLIYYKRNNFPILGSIQSTIRRITLYKRYFKEIEKAEGRIDLVHVNILYLSGMIGYLFKRFFKRKYVITEHWSGLTKQSGKKLNILQKAAIRLFANNASCIMPVTGHLERSMKELGIHAPFRVVPNVVDTSLFVPGNPAPRSIKNIIHISTMDPKPKNFEGILRVIERLRTTRQDFTLTVVASDLTYGRPYYDYVQQNGLNNYIHFELSKTPAEVAALMQSADFLILFSNYENLPCVMVEAMAAGIPVISTDVGGVKEHLDEVKGILIQKKDEQALFDALNTMLDGHQKYDKDKLHSYARAVFSYQAVGQQFDQIYKKVVND